MHVLNVKALYIHSPNHDHDEGFVKKVKFQGPDHDDDVTNL